MHILICSPESNSATGNWVTATRYAYGLESMGHKVTQCYLPPDQPVLVAVIEEHSPDLLLLLHAFRSGWQYILARQHLNIPTVVMLSGTDINEGLENVQQAHTIEQVMLHADALLSHNTLQIEQLKGSYPHLTRRLYFVPPAIELGNRAYPLRKQHHFDTDALIFLCPASVRPVKGLVELIELFDALVNDNQKWQLAFCGPVLDEEYAKLFFSAIERRSWAHYLGVIAPDAMPAALAQADVVLNNSFSEGLPNALIEASALGRPVLARDILGNRPVVDSGVNGFLYADRASFLTAAEKLINDSATRQRLAQPRAEQYALSVEAQALHRICELAFAEYSNACGGEG